MGGEHFAVAEGDGFDGAGGGKISAVERVEMGFAVTDIALVDVDFMDGGGVEEAAVDGEAGDGEGGVMTWLEGGEAEVGDGEVEGVEREVVERRDGGVSLEGEVALEARAACVTAGV